MLNILIPEDVSEAEVEGRKQLREYERYLKKYMSGCRCTWGGLPAKACIDIAAWDLKGKRAGMPLYVLLGGARSKMLSYASTPMFDTVEEYFPYLDLCIKTGFKAVKLHCYCVFEKDFKLVKAVQERYGDSGIDFMLDTATFYTPAQAMAMAKWLEANGWGWLEAPVSDYDAETYKWLVANTNLEISPHGNNLLTLKEVTNALANLHVALAHNNCRYFEQFFPWEDFEICSKDVIRTDSEGYVHAPEGPGLGIETDWDKVREMAVASCIFE